MLQKLGLIKYNSNFIFKKENRSQFYPTKTIIYRNDNSQINNKRKNYSHRSFQNNNNRNKYVKNEDLILKEEINRFIEESTSNGKIEIDHSNLVKIKHNIDDSIIRRNNLKLSFPTNRAFTTAQKLKYFKNSDYNIFNMFGKKIKNNKNSKEGKNQKIKFIQNLNNLDNIQTEINNKKILIKNLEIKNEALENKINIIKNEYNNNLLNNNDIDKKNNNNLFNLKYMKSYTNNNCNDLLSLKNNIIELKNQICINNKEQKLINLILFKEKIENELNKEDINKMNKLIENINDEKEVINKEILEIKKKNRILLSLIQIK